MRRSTLRLALLGMLLFISTNIQAQSWLDLINNENVSKVVNAVTGTTKAINMTGTWNYSGSAIEFKSDNLLKQAGGAVAATMAESKLNDQLAKVGIKVGQMNFTFHADSTFTSTVAKRKLSGTYSYDASTSKVNLMYARVIGLSAKVNCTSTNMELLFESDKILKVITLISSKTSNATLKTISAIADSYDGMLVGFELNSVR